MLTALPFTGSKRLKQTKRTSTNEWINKFDINVLIKISEMKT